MRLYDYIGGIGSFSVEIDLSYELITPTAEGSAIGITDDLDIWIWVDSSNIRKLLVALKEFGFNSLNLSEEDFNSPENVLQLGYAPNRIDLLVEIEGLKFEACFDRRTIVELDQIQIDFIGLDDLIEAKKNTGRLQDLADADQLEKLKRKHQNKA